MNRKVIIISLTIILTMILGYVALQRTINKTMNEWEVTNFKKGKELVQEQTITIKKGDFAHIALRYPSGTNYYRYTYSFNEQILKKSNEKDFLLEPDCSGCTEVKVAIFEAISTGKTEIVVQDLTMVQDEEETGKEAPSLIYKVIVE